MAKITQQKLLSIFKKGITDKVNPTSIIAGAIGGAVQADLKERFNYDFVNLGVKLLVFFTIMFVFAKFMEAVIFVRGGFLLLANLLGFKIPQADQVPQSLKDLFNDGVHGFKFWDIVKIVAMFLVVAEFMRYMSNNQGTKASPATIIIFIAIFAILGITTIPELKNRLQNTFNNPDELV